MTLLVAAPALVLASSAAGVVSSAAGEGKSFERDVLCKSRKGRDVPCARFGRLDGHAKLRLLLTSRHHCGEATATRVLEGVCESFLAEDELGVWLRENVEAFVVPFVDYDGVVDGDQGKGRKPHDHNRDYTEFCYPETRAIRDWAAQEDRVDFFIDFHCPWVRKGSNEYVNQVYGPDEKCTEQQIAFGKILERQQPNALGYLPVDDIVETANHFRCIDLVIESCGSALTERYVKMLHAQIKSGTGDSRKEWFAVGDYKRLDNVVGEMETCPAKDVHREMMKLLTWYKGADKTFETLLDLHVRFEQIHPFQDGNGRIGRLILLKECLKFGHTPFVIAENLRQFYYMGIKDWCKGRHLRLMETCRTGQDVFILGLRQFGHKHLAEKAERKLSA